MEIKINKKDKERREPDSEPKMRYFSLKRQRSNRVGRHMSVVS